MGVRIPNLTDPTKAWDPYAELEGPCKSMGVRIPNSRGHTKK